MKQNPTKQNLPPPFLSIQEDWNYQKWGTSKTLHSSAAAYALKASTEHRLGKTKLYSKPVTSLATNHLLTKASDCMPSQSSLNVLQGAEWNSHSTAYKLTGLMHGILGLVIIHKFKSKIIWSVTQSLHLLTNKAQES